MSKFFSNILNHRTTQSLFAIFIGVLIGAAILTLISWSTQTYLKWSTSESQYTSNQHGVASYVWKPINFEDAQGWVETLTERAVASKDTGYKIEVYDEDFIELSHRSSGSSINPWHFTINEVDRVFATKADWDKFLSWYREYSKKYIKDAKTLIPQSTKSN